MNPIFILLLNLDPHYICRNQLIYLLNEFIFENILKIYQFNHWVSKYYLKFSYHICWFLLKYTRIIILSYHYLIWIHRRFGNRGIISIIIYKLSINIIQIKIIRNHSNYKFLVVVIFKFKQLLMYYLIIRIQF